MYKVIYTDGAMNDLRYIAEYFAVLSSKNVAIDLISMITETIDSFSELPARGHGVPELRIIYMIEQNNVHVIAVLDSRRDVKEELERRLLIFKKVPLHPLNGRGISPFFHSIFSLRP